MADHRGIPADIASLVLDSSAWVRAQYTSVVVTDP